MTSEVATVERNGVAQALEQVVMHGDLKALDAKQRLGYYREVCQSVGLNPLTRPFDYILLNNKLTLYARKDATDQLRRINQVSIGKPEIEYADDLILVTVTATDHSGRVDSDMGVVAIGALKGEARANAILKAVTKAKRRVTLSICGLGWLDETEAESIPGARSVHVDLATGDIVGSAESPHTESSAAKSIARKDAEQRFRTLCETLSIDISSVAKVNTLRQSVGCAGSKWSELTPDEIDAITSAVSAHHAATAGVPEEPDVVDGTLSNDAPMDPDPFAEE